MTGHTSTPTSSPELLQQRVPARVAESTAFRRPRARRDYTQGSILRNIWILALPMTAEMGLMSLFEVVDLFWIGKLGESAMAALTVSSTMRFALMSMSMGLGMGATALVARRIGERDYEGANNTCLQAVILMVVVSVPLSTAGYLFAEPLVRLLGAEPNVTDLASAYLRITFAGLFPMVMLPMGNSLLRGAGSVNASFSIRALSIVACIVLEPPLIFGLGPVPALGILGSAMAVVLGRGLGTAVQLYVLWRGLTNIRLDLSHFKVDLPILWRIIEIGVPSVLQSLERSVGRMFLLAIITPFGTLALAAWSVGNQLSRMITIFVHGVESAATTLVGQNLGAGQPKRAESSAWAAAGLAMGLMSLASGLVLASAPALVRIFNPDPEIVATGSMCLRILALDFIFVALGSTMGRSLSGAGNTIPPMVISLASLWLIQLPLALTLRHIPSLGLNGVWTAIVISNVATGLTNSFWFKRGQWKRRRI